MEGCTSEPVLCRFPEPPSPPSFPGNQRDPNHGAWADLWEWVDAPLRPHPQHHHPPPPPRPQRPEEGPPPEQSSQPWQPPRPVTASHISCRCTGMNRCLCLRAVAVLGRKRPHPKPRVSLAHETLSSRAVQTICLQPTLLRKIV